MDVANAYRTLGLTPSASEDEVKAAYRMLAQKYQPDHYEAGPLHDDAVQKMAEIDDAFDTVMSELRTGGARADGAGRANNTTQTESDSKYSSIRRRINEGDADGALAQLNTIPNGRADAEWNFLVGSAYYYKGWLSQAQQYFATACHLNPSNREYAAALNNLNQSAGGSMYGNPYATGNTGAYNTAGAGCSCCDMCSALLCMNLCCGGGRGGC